MGRENTIPDCAAGGKRAPSDSGPSVSHTASCLTDFHWPVFVQRMRTVDVVAGALLSTVLGNGHNGRAASIGRQVRPAREQWCHILYLFMQIFRLSIRHSASTLVCQKVWTTFGPFEPCYAALWRPNAHWTFDRDGADTADEALLNRNKFGDVRRQGTSESEISIAPMHSYLYIA
jgi:hypothetical protein